MRSRLIAGRRRGILDKVQGCVKRPMKMIDDVIMNYALMNCQSLKMKLKSLASNFKMNKTCFIVTNETWFKKKDPQLKVMLEELDDENDIKVLRKDRKLGKTRFESM